MHIDVEAVDSLSQPAPSTSSLSIPIKIQSEVWIVWTPMQISDGESVLGNKYKFSLRIKNETVCESAGYMDTEFGICIFM